MCRVGKVKWLGVIALAVSLSLFMACGGETNDNPAVTSVTIVEGNQTVTRGSAFLFSANVVAVHGADEDVTWSVTGHTSAGTTIANGFLNVGLDEGEGPLTVRATSVFNSSRYGTATVTLVDPPGVRINERNAIVGRGSSFQFTANVVVPGGQDNTLAWSVQGAAHSGTTINATTGYLTVNANETAASLTVRAQSNFDMMLNDTVTVTIQNEPVIRSVTITSEFDAFLRGETYLFTHTVDGDNLAGAVAVWSVTGSTNPQTGFLTSAEPSRLSVAQDEAAANLRVRVTVSIGSLVEYAETDPINVSDLQRLDTPATPTWAGNGVINFTALANEGNVASYNLRLYRGETYITTATVNQGQATNHNFLANMRNEGPGAFTVTVTAISANSALNLNSNASYASAEENVTRLATPTGLAWNNSSVEWAAVTDAVFYIVRLYDSNGAFVTQAAPTALTHNWGAGFDGQLFTGFTVTAIAPTTGLVIDSLVSPLQYYFAVEVSPFTGFGSTTPAALAFGANMFVAVGGGGRIASSPDGENWTMRHEAGSAFRWVTWGQLTQDSGLFVAIGEGTPSALMTSPDGITWTNRSVAAITGNWSGAAFGGGMFMLIGPNGQAAWSRNGETWTHMAADFAVHDGRHGRGVTFDEYNRRFYVVHDRGRVTRSNQIDAETTAVTWSLVSHTIFQAANTNTGVPNGRTMAFGDNIIVATEASGNIAWAHIPTGAGGHALWHRPGTGASGSTFGNQDVANITFANGRFVIVGGNGQIATARTNADGSSWNADTRWTPFTLAQTRFEIAGNPEAGGRIASVAYGNGIWVFAGLVDGQARFTFSGQ